MIFTSDFGSALSALKILHAQVLTLVIITGCFDKIDSRLSVIVMNSVVLMSVITFDCQAVEGERSAPKDGQITTFMKMAEEEEETLTKTTAATNQQAAHGQQQQQQQQQANNNEATITTAINQTTTTPPSSSSVISSSFNPKIKVHLVAVGSAPILKKNKFLMNRTDNFGVAISFLRKRLKLNNNTNTTATNTTTPFSSSGSASSAVSSNVVQSSSLFLYVNSAFVPSPTEQIGDLYDCFGMRDELVIHYSLQEAWG
jgi:ubiquitin-like protein ATG12